MAYIINDRVTWVGKIDWELNKFHGDEYSTFRGSSYNSYLIRDEKTVLIDTVWKPHAKEFVEKLKKEINLKEIDYIIANHGEIDHSGALPELMREIPNTPIYCTKNAVRSIKGHYHEDWNFVEVKTGDTLDIGKNKLIFIEARMLHWPDTMMTYMTGDNILFSNDAFGQHYASELMHNDLVDNAELYQEAIKYYANILSPFSALVARKIEEILALKFPVDMICPSHGVIWRDNPLQIVEKYMEWAKNYSENQVSIVYDTMWEGTQRMAHAIAEGIKEVAPALNIKIFNTSKHDKNEIITEVFKSKVLLLGSSTINKGILSSVAAILEMIKGAGFKDKRGAAFGSYGWSGESVGIIEDGLKEAGFEIIHKGLKALWNPDNEALEQCRDMGREIGKKV